MKKKFKLFCFGFGQVAKYFVKNLIDKNLNFDLVTTNTKNTQLKEFNNLKYKSYFFLNDKFDKDLISELEASTKVLVSVPPIKGEELVIKIFKENLKKNKFDWITYLSATSVYGDKKGQWVDENTKPQPTSARGIARLNAENQWLKQHKDFNLPIQIFRLSGIYSLESNVIKRLTMGNVKIVEKKNHFFSRIHVEDIAEILKLSLNNFNSGHVFNLSDDYPCSNEEIAQYAAKLINIKMN